MDVAFKVDQARGVVPDGELSCVFERHGEGLHVAKPKLKRPMLLLGRPV